MERVIYGDEYWNEFFGRHPGIKLEKTYVVKADLIEYTNNDCWDLVGHDLYSTSSRQRALEIADKLENEGYDGEPVSNLRIEVRVK